MTDHYFALRLSDELQRAAAASSAAERSVHLAACRLLVALAEAEPGMSRPNSDGIDGGAPDLG